MISETEFRSEAKAFLDAHAEPRVEEKFEWGKGSDRVGVLEEKTPEQEAAEIRGGNVTDGHGCGERIAGIRARHYCEESTQFSDGARQWSDDAYPCEGAGAGRIVAGGGNAAGGGLESADAAEVRGSADGAAAVAADSAH